MTKKTETTFQEEKEAKEQVEAANTERRVSQQISDVLNLSGYALQPFLSFSEYGVVPRVRLVKNPEAEEEANKQDTNDTGTDTKESGEGTDSDKPAEPSES